MAALLWIITFLGTFMVLSLAVSGGAEVDPVVLVWVTIFALLILLVVYWQRGEDALLARLGRGGLVVLPLLLVALVPICLVFAAIGSDVRLWQGLLAGLVVVLGWLSTFLFQEERVAKDRRDKEIDVLLALRAEILNFLWKYNDENFDERIQGLEKLRTDRRRKVPIDFLPRHGERIVFGAVASDLPLIDDLALSRAVAFYTQAEDLAQFALDLRDPSFAGIKDRDVKIDELINYLEMQKLAIIHGLRAVARINEIVPEDRLAMVDAVAGDGTQGVEA